MTCYFPIPPSIKNNSKDKILGSLTLLNFPNNFKKSNQRNIYKKNIFLGIYILEKNYWKLLNVFSVPYKEFKEIEREKLNISDNEMAVVVISKTNEFPSTCIQLPNPSSLRIDESPVAERASYNFSYKNNQTSFQGEYPKAMTSLSKPSFFGFDTLKADTKNEKIINYILFINLNSCSNKQSNDIVNIFHPKEKNILFQLETRENQISVHNLSLLYDSKISNETLFLSSKRKAYIALILSIDLETCHLSLEHTHPPAEMATGMDRHLIVKPIKNNWVI